jgi:hypothetical protein
VWVYRKQSDTSYLIGFYPSSGGFQSVGTKTTEADAQALVSYLNGGSAPTG